METKLQALKLVLEALEVQLDISSLDNRKTLQKAVYLGQQAGVDLGYRYGWYIRGPYSPPLAEDYYALASALKTGEKVDSELRDEIRTKLEHVRPLFAVPEGVRLDQDDWLELLASVHFLRKVARQSPEKAEQTLKTAKPHVVDFFGVGTKALEQASLL